MGNGRNLGWTGIAIGWKAVILPRHWLAEIYQVRTFTWISPNRPTFNGQRLLTASLKSEFLHAAISCSAAERALAAPPPSPSRLSAWA